MMGELDEIIARLGAVEGEGPAIAVEAAPEIEAHLQKTLAAGTTPEGAPWLPRKAGGRAYVNAANAIAVRAYGDIIRGKLTGPEVYGHFGAHGMPVRQMIPDVSGGVPEFIARAISRAAGRVFRA